MKLLSPEQCLELLPSTEGEAHVGAELFGAILAGGCQRDYYRTAFTEGWSNPSTVWKDGKQAGVVGWHRTMDGGLWLDMAVAFEPLNDPEISWRALAILEAKERPRYTRLLTMRRGMVHAATRHGFTPLAVLCEREGVR